MNELTTFQSIIVLALIIVIVATAMTTVFLVAIHRLNETGRKRAQARHEMAWDAVVAAEIDLMREDQMRWAVGHKDCDCANARSLAAGYTCPVGHTY